MLVLLSLALALPAARADLVFNGFGQIVAGTTLGNQHPFPGEPYSADLSFQSESLFALQVRADLANSLSATAQVVAQGSNDFTPKFAWAYASYQIDDHWSLKGGRQRLPLFQYSDYLQVGEAYPWVRPPPAAYTVPIANFDGFTFSGDYQLGKLEVHPRFFFGNDTTAAEFQNQTLTATGNNIIGDNIEFVYDEWLSFTGSYFFAKTTINSPDIDSLLDTLEALGDTATVAALADNNHPAQFASFGFEANRDHWLFGGEYTHITVNNSFIPKDSGYYIVAGYHFGPLMPLLTYGHGENKFTNPNVVSTIKPVTNPNPDPPAPAPLDCNEPPPAQLPCDPTQAGCVEYIEYAGAVSGVSCIVQQSHQINDYFEAGLRYDISNRTALKLDYTRYVSHVAGTPGSNLLSATFTFNF